VSDFAAASLNGSIFGGPLVNARARAGTSPNWLKVKNPKHRAMVRVKMAFS
jgi:hypothetical protein